MTDDFARTLAGRQGHFVLESGYHTDTWFDLDGLFISPNNLKPRIANLAKLLRPYSPTAICGPLLGGAFVAQSLAAHMDLRFYFSQRILTKADDGKLFGAQYQLPTLLQRQVSHERVAVVDDIVSAGSSVRATIAALDKAGATVVVVGALLVLGSEALAHFASCGISMVMPTKRGFNLWQTSECPLCRAGAPLEDPTGASGYSAACSG
jgi:orotate phosphoribosyltransferase